MKKFIVVLFVLVGINVLSYSAVSAVSSFVENGSKIIGKPKDKNWVVKVKDLDGFSTISFSEDKGKTFFTIREAYAPHILIWSPNGQYLMIVGSPAFSMHIPCFKDGIWKYYPLIYNPIKRVIFNSPNISETQDIVGASWAKGTESDLLIGIYNGAYYEQDGFSPDNPTGPPDQTKKLTIHEWEVTSSDADFSPYLDWYTSQIIARLKTGKPISPKESKMWLTRRDSKEQPGLDYNYLAGYKYKKGTDVKVEIKGNSFVIYVLDVQGNMACPLTITMDAELNSAGLPVIVKAGSSIMCID